MGDLDLDSATPILRIRAENAKNRTEATIPLAPSAVSILRPMLEGKTPKAKVFRFPSRKNLAEMLKTDLKRAGIPYELDGRYLDFHAAGRVYFGSQLAKNRVHPKVAQMLLTHKTIGQTMKHYTQMEILDLAGDAAKVPIPMAPIPAAVAVGAGGSIGQEDRWDRFSTDSSPEGVDVLESGHLLASLLAFPEGQTNHNLTPPDPCPPRENSGSGWRRGELNPRPETFPGRHLHAYPAV